MQWSLPTMIGTVVMQTRGCGFLRLYALKEGALKEYALEVQS